jgi:hypothetical protein
MKRLLLYFTLLAVVFTACDPIENRDSLSGTVSEDALELSAEPIVVDGRNSNEVVVENNSPVLSRWISDRSQVESAYSTIVFDYLGTRDVQFVGLNGNGSMVEKSLSVELDTMTNLTAEMKTRLGIKYNDDGTVDKTSMPYFFGNADYVQGTGYTVSIEQEVAVNGKAGNKLTLKCDAPYLCNWTFGGATANKNSTELFITDRGTFTLSLDMTKADGTVIENAYTEEILVEELTTVPDEYTNLFGDFLSNPDITKTWQWSRSGKVWANGPLRGFTDPGAGWWQNSYEDMIGRQDGTMTFKYSDMTLTKEVLEGGDASIDPVGTHTGTIALDLGSSVEGYSIGLLKLNGISILYGVDVNDGNAPFTELSIVSVTENTLILGGDSDGSGQTWLYKFEAVTD